MGTETALALAKDNPMPDEEVVQRVRAGEVELFEIIMRRYNQRLYRVARAILGDDSAAEEVMENAYGNAYLHLDQFAGRARFSTWLIKIAVYEALAHLRHYHRSVAVDTLSESNDNRIKSLASPAPDPEQQALNQELSSALKTAVAGLPQIYRSVFMLREVEGMSVAETAECLSISEETVKIRLHRARTLLQSKLTKYKEIPFTRIFRFHAMRCDRVVLHVIEKIRFRM